MSRGQRKLSDIAVAHEARTAKLCKRTLGGCVWYPGSPYGICGKVLRCCKVLVGNESANMILYHTGNGV